MATGNDIVIETAERFWAAIVFFHNSRPDGMDDDRLRTVADGYAEHVIEYLAHPLPAWTQLDYTEKATFMTHVVINLLPRSMLLADHLRDHREGRLTNADR